MLDRHVAYLDRLAVDIRVRHSKAISRAEMIRALVEAAFASDVDLKRAGQLDRKIPFLYSQTPEEVENVARAVLRKNRIQTSVDLPSIRDGFSAKLVGYSNADVEAVILMANDDAAREGTADVDAGRFTRAAADYFPSRDVERLAVFEAASRRLLPPKDAGVTPVDEGLRIRHAQRTSNRGRCPPR
jgi:SpoVK/Ycf46/Vps4 family AAA+-type ATPase